MNDRILKIFEAILIAVGAFVVAIVLPLLAFRLFGVLFGAS